MEDFHADERFSLTEEQRTRLEAQNRARNDALSPYAARDEDAVYLVPRGDDPLRPPYSRDADFILNCPFYNRYADKTQVFSFFKNDDLTRRALHVQLVSKIARSIGRALGLNLDLIEAIALAHDMGHPPFGHMGEEYLNEVYHAHTGRYFHHNVHSARIFRYIYDCRISLQTLSGILSHNGEMPMDCYRPVPLTSFSDFDALLERCYLEKDFQKTLIPNTMEGCVVRVSDMIAYIGKDRQDFFRSGLKRRENFPPSSLGLKNRELLSSLTQNVVRSSMDSPALRMDREVFEAMKKEIEENYELIYRSPLVNAPYERVVHPLMRGLYERLLSDMVRGDEASPIFRHHLGDRILRKSYYGKDGTLTADPNEVVCDFIASMTDDYFIDICKYLHIDDALTSSENLRYREYFD